MVLSVIGIVSGCSRGGAINNDYPEGDGSVYIRATQAGVGDMSRTVIGGEALDRTFWSELDEIGVYWRSAGSSDQVQGAAFSCCRIFAEDALFSGKVEQTPGDYTYYGVYPVPQSVSGTKVTYSLPSVQDGTYGLPDIDIRDQNSHASYRGNLDYMIAVPSTGGALVDDAGQPSFSFVHKCHIMRVQVPVGRNKWGENVTKLRVEFPSAVAGTMTMDMADPYGTPVLSNGSNTIIAELRNPLTESLEDDEYGNYVWLFLCPGQVTGTVRFTAYDSNNYQAGSLSVQLDKTLAPGRITPVNLTVPDELPVTWIDFSIDGNNLGEEPRSFTVVAPEGAKFRNGDNTKMFNVNAENKYSLGFYNEYDGIANGELIKSKGLTIIYDSDNAIVSETRKFNFNINAISNVSLTVPYLFFEDFSGVSSFNYYDDKGSGSSASNPSAKSLAEYGLPAGWTGSRVGGDGGNAVRVCCHFEGAGLAYGRYDGRMDSSPIIGIKDGRNVKVKVTYNYDGGCGNSDLYPVYWAGYTTSQDGFNGSAGVENVQINKVGLNTNMNYSNIGLESGFEIASCTNRHRLSWKVSNSREGAWTWNGFFADYFLYLDNIRITIIK